ncbi:MAG: VWA domain-containing protein, partial [Myxococcales bacterium]|nr:VWA domain-containing protein [Myxococcales bacterium]
PPPGEPVASQRWALAQADVHRARFGDGTYRGLPPVVLWGLLEPAATKRAGAVALDAETAGDLDDRHRPKAAQMPRRPEVREATEGEDDEGEGAAFIVKDQGEQSVEDPMGLQRPADREVDVDADEIADSLSELREARVVRSRERAKEVLLGQAPPPRQIVAAEGAPVPDGVVYPEWDYRAATYRAHGAVVREVASPLGDPAWAAAALARHALLVREVRRRFERLRPQRERLGRQVDGEEIDLDAFVTAYADRAAGCLDADRLYATVRPRRRDLAVCLLVDASASTDSWVAAKQRVVDVEKEALLVVCEALEALGDPYAIQAFSGQGPEAVTVAELKRFGEHLGEPVHRRIAGLEPERYTRVGAALRHATASLMRRGVRHPVLLLLSDGKPNDLDVYEGRYGVEDTRQAVLEAREQGASVLCLTVDRQAPSYIPRVFGPGSYFVLRRPELLPQALVGLMKQLVSR